MSFIETRAPNSVCFGAKGGPMFVTDVVELNWGEQRNQVWQYPRLKYDVSHVLKDTTALAALSQVFYAAAGRANGFRFKDWSDYHDTDAGGVGILGTGAVGTGLPTYQMYKSYTFGAVAQLRKITKPVSGGVTPTRNGSNVTIGAGAGNASIDSTTGIVTFVADVTSSASAITAGTTTQVTLAANLGLVSGKLLYLSGFTGADAALVNGIAHTINSVTGSGPYVFTLATNTNGKTITLGSGAGAKYPQASESLGWTGQFDVPVRFDSDWNPLAVTGPNIYHSDQITLLELPL